MKFNIDVVLFPEQMAEAFCEMDGMQQAKCIVHIMQIAKTWGEDPNLQWMEIGKRLVELPSGHDAVEYLNNIVEYANHHIVKTVTDS